MGEHRSLGPLTTLALSGGAAIILGVRGLEVIDVGLPEAARRLGGNSTVQGVDLAIAGDRIVALGRERLVVLQLERPLPPLDVVAWPGGGEIEITWSPRDGGVPAAAHDVYRTSPGPRAKVNARPVAGTSFTAAGLPNGVEHCFVVQASSASGAASEDSAPACATPEGPLARFLRGDCDGDGLAAGRVTDAVFLLDHNFRGGPRPPCLAACDADGDGRVEGQVTDAVYLLNHNFRGGPPPRAPFPECGPGALETDGALGCESPPEGCESP